MVDHSSVLKETFNEYGFPITAHQAAQFEQYRDALLRWNRQFNLTAITDKVEITQKHFLDSLGVLEHITLKRGDTVMDIGTGAGFPGVVLKIYVPDIRLTLVEASKKKGSFLRFLIAKLNLHQETDVEVLTGRAEDWARDPNHTGAYDWGFHALRRDAPKFSSVLYAVLKVDREMGGLQITERDNRYRNLMRARRHLTHLAVTLKPFSQHQNSIGVML